MDAFVKQPQNGFYIIPNNFIDNDFSLDAATVVRLGKKNRFYLRKYIYLIREINHHLKYGGISYRIKLWKKKWNQYRNL